jgi:hypothetical protein
VKHKIDLRFDRVEWTQAITACALGINPFEMIREFIPSHQLGNRVIDSMSRNLGFIFHEPAYHSRVRYIVVIFPNYESEAMVYQATYMQDARAWAKRELRRRFRYAHRAAL